MKHCPTCRETYTDETLKFCRADGTLLLSDSALESSKTLPLSTGSDSTEVPIRALKVTPSIAVLPFVNMSADQENEFFCDGLAEELINALTKIETLHVAARTSAFSFKGKEVDAREIGRRLNVATVFEGSVRKAGSRLRITAQLINVADGYHLWSERYDRQMEDIFEIQDEISLAIVDALKVRLLGEEKAALLRRYTENTEAHKLYLKGRYHWNKRSADEMKKAIEFYQQAIDLDPNYALAYTGLADSYGLLGIYGYLPPKDTLPKAKAAANKALEIDDQLAEAHASLGVVKGHYDYDWLGAERESKRAIELNPGYATAHNWYAGYLAMIGRHEEAIAEAKRAQQLDPLSLIINTDVGWHHYFARQYDKAIEQLWKVLDLDPGFAPAHLFLGQAYEQREMYQEAFAELNKAVSLSGSSPRYVAVLGYTYAVSGKRGEAQKVLDELSELSKRRYVQPFDLALIYTGIGEEDHAFAWLEKAYKEHNGWLMFIKVEPMFDMLRSDPRFIDLVRRIGLPQ